MRCIFVADIHLRPSDPGRTRRFLEFLAEQAPSTDRLYILGDLFDLWIGPRHEHLPDHKEFLDALPSVLGARMQTFFIYGNRDFFVGPNFPSNHQVRTLGPSCLVALGGRRVYLTHGDELCSKDLGYWLLTVLFRNRFICGLNRALPFWATRYCVQAARTHARRSVAGRERREVAVVEDAVVALFKRRIDVVVCGHVHSSRHAVFRLGRRDRELYVLGPWRAGTCYLLYEDSRWALHPQVETEEVVVRKRRGDGGGRSAGSVPV